MGIPVFAAPLFDRLFLVRYVAKGVSVSEPPPRQGS
jgi:hypothetical protein